MQRIEKSLPHMAVEAFFPAKWFGLDELKPGMRLRANIALVSYFREFAMVWAGNPEIERDIGPAGFHGNRAGVMPISQKVAAEAAEI